MRQELSPGWKDGDAARVRAVGAVFKGCLALPTPARRKAALVNAYGETDDKGTFLAVLITHAANNPGRGV